MDPSGRDTDLNLLPIETQIKVLKTNGRSRREENYDHTSRIFGHSILMSK